MAPTTTIMGFTIVQSICSALWQICQIYLYKNVFQLSATRNDILDAIQVAYYTHVELPFGIKFDFNESDRVRKLAIAHLTVDIVWILVSLMALCVKSKNNSAYSVNILWMCTAAIELVIDGTSVALFANDAKTWQNSFLPQAFISGAILMAVVSSRFVFFLLMNVWMFLRMVCITHALNNSPVSGVRQYQYRQQQATLI